MGKKTPITTSFNLPDGREVTLETGKLATQSDGSCVVRMGNTMLFASVVSATKIREGQSFFPLSVDYQEKYASIGRIPGNFFRREARLSDYEILTSRLVDRAIRPLFPDGYMYDTQVIINLISAEQEVFPDALVALAASTALSVSDIPFAGPISEVRVAKIKGEYVVNPNRTPKADATMDIIIAATIDNVMMVEGEANECSEKELVEAIKVGHEAIKIQCQAQMDLAQKVGEKATIKREIEAIPENEDVKKYVEDNCKEAIEKICRGALPKDERKNGYKAIKEALAEKSEEDFEEEFLAENGDFFDYYFGKLKKEVIREMILSEKMRLDGRKPNKIRDIWTEVDYLPSAHGSAIFTRGETQSLTSLTLGTKLDQALMDTALEMKYENFILHYNFPAYSVGETRPMRGPGRREVGHANLAARSLRQVLPEDNAYTIRLVSDILESNGSSSMATVCAGSLALMDGGVQIKAPVSGIAMGMVADGERSVILSDILGDEDAVGDMDFKVTGTAAGITACQMDIKIDGLPYEQLEEALNQARVGRLHILECMKESLTAPREDYKPHAPRIVKLEIDKTFIGAVIGPGGKIIQEMQETTGTTINIEEVDGKGIIHISSPDRASIDKALDRIKTITYTPQVGDIWEARVVSIMPYGVFVDFNGQSGLLHISEISHTRIENVTDVFKEGDEVKVKLIAIDQRSGKFRLSRKVLMQKPEKNPAE
ncbi:MAG: polyribonucleotide nucleotidyltransferase [Bacteroidia bacterium]|nr:polyribonucleotide nucleotidyltransferase [Bacteroidia bacterium]